MILRHPTDSDADWIAEACQDPDIRRWTTVPIPYDRRDAEIFIATWAGSLLVYAITEGDPGGQSEHNTGPDAGRGIGGTRGLGMASIHRVIDGDAQLGYWIAPWARRRGVATWATLAMVEIAATMDGVVTASLDIANDNVASQGVAHQAGFIPGPTPEGLTVPDGDSESAATRFVLTIPR